MAALIDLEDIIIVAQREPTSGEEAALWQFYIDAVSDFINSYVYPVSFVEVTDDVVRRQADSYGLIDLGGDPVSTVSSVKNWRTQLETAWDWDGLGQIGLLDPHEVVEITFTHGYTSVPGDIKNAAVQAVLGAIGLGATGPLTSFTVGDVTEVYSHQRQDTTLSVISLAKDVLDKYATTYGSWRLQHNQFPTANRVLPEL